MESLGKVVGYGLLAAFGLIAVLWGGSLVARNIAADWGAKPYPAVIATTTTTTQPAVIATTTTATTVAPAMSPASGPATQMTAAINPKGVLGATGRKCDPSLKISYDCPVTPNSPLGKCVCGP